MWSQVGPQPIQVSEINSYLKDTIGLEDYEERQKYLRLIAKMDSVEMRYFDEKRKAAAK